MPSQTAVTVPVNRLEQTAAIRPLPSAWLEAADSRSLQRALRLSVMAHVGLLVLVGLLSLLAVLLTPEIKSRPDMTFELVKNPSKTLPDKPDAKGDAAQLAGGKKKRVEPSAQAPAVAAVRPVQAPKPAKPYKPIAMKPVVVPSEPVSPYKKPDTRSPDNLNNLSVNTPVPGTPDQTTAQAQTPAEPSESVGEAPTEQLAVMPDEMAPYLKGLKERLSANWQPPRGEHTLRVVTQFVIEGDGRISAIEIKESSGDAAVDEAARKALENSSPVETIPATWGVSRVPILFTFDYTVYGKSLRRANARP